MDDDWIIQEIRRQDAEDAYRNQIGLPTLDAPEPDWLEVYRILSQASVQREIRLKKKAGKMTFEVDFAPNCSKNDSIRTRNRSSLERRRWL